MSKPIVFISHAGTSTVIAKYIYDWLETLLHSVKPWASFNNDDLPAGKDDHRRIIEAAIKSDMCLLVLTPEALKSPWVLFEPGIFYGQEKEVIVLLCNGLTHEYLKKGNYPLSGYHCYPIKNSMLNMVNAINKYCKLGIDSRVLEKSFDKFIGDFLDFYTTVENKINDKEKENEKIMKEKIKVLFSDQKL